MPEICPAVCLGKTSRGSCLCRSRTWGSRRLPPAEHPRSKPSPATSPAPSAAKAQHGQGSDPFPPWTTCIGSREAVRGRLARALDVPYVFHFFFQRLPWFTLPPETILILEISLSQTTPTNAKWAHILMCKILREPGGHLENHGSGGCCSDAPSPGSGEDGELTTAHGCSGRVHATCPRCSGDTQLPQSQRPSALEEGSQGAGIPLPQMCDPQIVSGLWRGCSVDDVVLENVSPQTH